MSLKLVLFYFEAMTSRHQGSGLGTSVGPSEEELKESLAKLISYVAELRLFLKECPVWLKKDKAAVPEGILFIMNRSRNSPGESPNFF